ncbi:MAG: complex I subunit 5 family protein [Rhizomicrobium sp.]
MAPAALIPLVVVGPLALAAALLAFSHYLPKHLDDIVAPLMALAVAVLCAVLAVETARHGPIAYWFGGWTPRAGLVLGIGFGVDVASAVLGAFVALLFATTFVFAWGFFDEVHGHFQVLMLLFLAAMEGFCLTRDLFNLFVWFEVMSVAAFALTAYQLETPSLAGALNFTVTNSLASFMMLGGVGLVYARTGLLDFGALSHALARHPLDPVVAGAFCLLAAALMIKAAIVPFHFWLSDAHAVAPTPVSVIFSGAMVSVGLFALAKLGLGPFFASKDAHFLLHDWFTALGCVTAVVGGIMAWSQRHLKRMLAFSTIAHLGIMLLGIASISSLGLAGFLVYFVGHGLVKAALFMVAGILLAMRASVDEINLKGLGRGIWPAGIGMGLGGILLGGAPFGALDRGTQLVQASAWQTGGFVASAAIVIGTVLTGAAVLRAAGRIFLDLDPDPGEEANSPTQDEREKANRPLWLMLAPCVLLLLVACVPAEKVDSVLAQAAFMMAPQLGNAAAPLAANTSHTIEWLCVALTVALAVLKLYHTRIPRPLVATTGRLIDPPLKALKKLHSGLIPDYVVWITVGFAAFAAVLVVP